MANSKSTVRLTFGILFSLIYIACLIGFITLAILIQPISFMDFMATESKNLPSSYLLVTLFFAAMLITSIFSIILLYGCEKNILCKILYVVSFLPIGVLGIGIPIIIGIVWLIHKGADVQAHTSSYSYSKTINVKDKAGNESKLQWDNNTETWRDSMGSHYTSSDDGKTFRQK